MSKGKSVEVLQLRLMASLAFSLLGASALGVLSMEAYPNPYFFGVFLGVLAAGLTRSKQDEEERALTAVVEYDQPPVLAPGPVRPASQ